MSESTGPRLAGRILVVDDLPDAATSLAMVCQLYGAEAAIASDGMKALSLGETFRPDVVLMDGHLLKPVGVEALISLITELETQRRQAAGRADGPPAQ